MKILVFAGAGISAESGLNTFRDKDGLWTKYDINEVCNYHNFLNMKKDASRRKHLFDFYNEIKVSCDKASPNLAHIEIANWQKQYGVDNVLVVTSNVDDLFEKAGIKNVLHVHGDLQKSHCTSCQTTWNETYFNHETRCPKCSSRQTKPNVVFFGEMAPKYKDLNRILIKKRKKEDFLVVIGTSFNVIDAEWLVGGNRHNTILINKDESSADGLFAHKLIGNASNKIFEATAIINN